MALRALPPEVCPLSLLSAGCNEPFEARPRSHMFSRTAISITDVPAELRLAQTRSSTMIWRGRSQSAAIESRAECVGVSVACQLRCRIDIFAGDLMIGEYHKDGALGTPTPGIASMQARRSRPQKKEYHSGTKCEMTERQEHSPGSADCGSALGIYFTLRPRSPLWAPYPSAHCGSEGACSAEA